MPYLRTILDLPSSLSLLSFETRSADDLSSIHSHSGTISTVTSASTVGIGTTSAKVLTALGQLTIRYAEYMELLVVSRKFPHRDDQHIRNIGATYHTLLELSRPCIGHPVATRRRALSLLLSQIMSRQTKYLLQALIKWPAVDIKIFLAEIMEDGRQDLDQLALCIIDLLVSAARQSSEGYSIFLQAGMLDILLYFYLGGDLNPNTQRAAQKACFDLAKLHIPVEGRDLDLVNHHILPLIAPRPTKHYSYVSAFALRGQAWRLTHLALVRRRFLAISSAVREGQWVIWGSEWIVDLVEFMSEHFGNEIPFLAFNTFANVIQQREQLVEHVLTQHFKQSSKTRDTVFRSIVHMCTSLFQDPIIIPLAVDRHRLRHVVICYIVPLLCAIARASSVCLDALLDAGIVELLWAIALLQDTSYLHFKEDNLVVGSREYEIICREIMDEASQTFMPGASDPLLASSDDPALLIQNGKQRQLSLGANLGPVYAN